MRLINQSHEIINQTPSLEKTIELSARTCYKSEHKIHEGSDQTLIQKLIRMGHESVLEHGSITVKFITDRAVSHELVRHRIASFSQESQRYVGYRGEVEFIRPWFISEEHLGLYEKSDIDTILEMKDVPSSTDDLIMLILLNFAQCEWTYKALVAGDLTPQKARAVLPNSTKTEIIVSTNPREWRHILRLRTGPGAYPQIRELMLPVLDEFSACWPSIFNDLKEG